MGSAQVILLDTHVAIWMIGDERMLGAQSRKIIQSAREENKLAISAISFWEIALLVAKDRKVLFNMSRRAPERQDFDDIRKAIDKLIGPSPVPFSEK